MAASVPSRTTGIALPLLQRVLLAMMLVAIGLPLPFSALVHFSPAPIRLILTSAPLHDNVTPPERPELSLLAWWRGELQPDFESWFGSRIEPRGGIVRLTNQIYYSAFAKSYMYRQQIIVGRDQYLFELAYLRAYCGAADHDVEAASAQLVAKLSELRRELARRDRWMLFLLTPSKAVTMPEFLPAGLCGNPVAPERKRQRFVASLRHAGVATIDGPELVQVMRAHDPLPPFPRGSTHWSRVAGTRLSARVMQEMNRLSERDMGSITVGPVRWDAPPTDTDADLARLLNLWRPPLDYLTGSVGWRCRSGTEGRNTRLIAVGGSFLEQVLSPIVECGLFSRADYYFYYDLWRHDLIARRVYPVDRATIKWREELARPTVLLVELNEQWMDGGATHLDRFFDDLRGAFDPVIQGRLPVGLAESNGRGGGRH